ncbi:MAG: ComEC/Rec2 family competence protein [Bacteroidota bacterium]
MRRYGKQFWRSVPFVRLLIPLTAGIVLSHYEEIPVRFSVILSVVSLTVILLIRLTSKFRYQLRWINGLSFNLLVVCFGCLLMHFQNIENDGAWLGNHISKSTAISITLQEPLTAKPNSYKALAKVDAVLVNSEWQIVKGSILIYFKKDSIVPALQYGSQIIIQKSLQPITNSGNPGAFDYKQYCAQQDIHYQVYLQPKDYLITGKVYKNSLTELLINTRSNVLSIFRKWVPGETEAGVAEALLIGYRDDLDKDLVRSYSNTGVVHIIAISGLHLGMIYGLMLLLIKPFRKQKWMRWVKPLLILFVLWGFSLLAGAAASILRSVVMFSFIVIGESLGRRTNIYNTLAASAFCLLVYNPYFFWDVGFQLSYTAVLSIVLFMKPIYQWFYFKNKLLNALWQLNAITISAQILTLPIILYYFHQFPNLFLFTNFIAVPLSGFILYGELLLLLVCKIPFLNVYTGKAVSFLINQMNTVIERTARLPFSVIDNIQVSIVQTVILYIAISYFAWWLLQKKRFAFLIGTGFLSAFILVRSVRLIHQSAQQKLIVYNIARQRAIDIIDGNGYRFIGDASSTDQNFNLLPSRVLHGAQLGELANTNITGQLVTGRHRSVLIVDNPFILQQGQARVPVDIIILSGNPRIYLSQLAAVFDCPQYVFDSSNPLWKIQYWKKDADSLHLRHHTISEQGAFEVDL